MLEKFCRPDVVEYAKRLREEPSQFVYDEYRIVDKRSRVCCWIANWLVFYQLEKFRKGHTTELSLSLVEKLHLHGAIRYALYNGAKWGDVTDIKYGVHYGD